MSGRCSTAIMPRYRRRRRTVMAELGRDETELTALGAQWTAREIAQQPAMLRQTQAMLLARKDAVERFLRPLIARAALASEASGQRGHSIGARAGHSPEEGSSARAALASEASGQRGHSIGARAGHSPEEGSSARADLRVVLAGAGTSAFIGECLAPWFAARLGRQVE